MTYAHRWMHYSMEFRKAHHRDGYDNTIWKQPGDTCCTAAEARMAERLRAVLTRRRKDRHLRRSRWEYAVGRGKDE